MSLKLRTCALHNLKPFLIWRALLRLQALYSLSSCKTRSGVKLLHFHSNRPHSMSMSLPVCHQVSDLDVWSCSVTFCEMLPIHYVPLWKKPSFTAFWLIRYTHTQTNLKRPTAAKDGLSAFTSFPLKINSHGLHRLRLWKETSKNRSHGTNAIICRGSTMPSTAMTFLLNSLIVSFFRLCLSIPYPVLICPLFPLCCSSLQSLTGDSRVCSLVLSGWFSLLSNRLLRLTQKYIGLWHLQYAIPSLSYLPFSQSDWNVWGLNLLMTFTQCLLLLFCSDCFYIVYSVPLYCWHYYQAGLTETCKRAFCGIHHC